MHSVRSLMLCVAAACGLSPLVAATNPHPALPKIRVDSSSRAFVDTDGRAFRPWGINYFRPGTGWAPQVWKQFDPEATRLDFQRMRSVGVNCVRVFLTYGSFLSEPDRVSVEGLEKLDQFLALAEAAGLYVHPTGPDHWEGLPEWARADRYTEEGVLRALELFWREVASRYRGRAVLFAYDLLNEPEVPWDTPSIRKRWNEWLISRYGNRDDLRKAWGDLPPDFKWGEAAPPPAQDAANRQDLRDYQRFREEIADEWTRRQVAAIKAADPEALVTVGLIQWSVPVVLAHPGHYSAFRPVRQARFLDFLEVHFYPFADGAYAYQGPEMEARNLAYLDAVVREVARPGKPVVIAEFGWYGGGLPKHVAGAIEATEEQQARWCRRLVETTASQACGWLNWGFYDQPEAGDVSERIGLAKPDGTLKVWGRVFAELGRSLTALAERPHVEKAGLPSLDWEAACVSEAARREFREQYLEAWEAGGP